jgi:hypothetical protein
LRLVHTRFESARIPDSAFGPQADPAKGYWIEELRPGMYVVSESTYMVLVVVSELAEKSAKGDVSKVKKVKVKGDKKGCRELNSKDGGSNGWLASFSGIQRFGSHLHLSDDII